MSERRRRFFGRRAENRSGTDRGSGNRGTGKSEWKRGKPRKRDMRFEVPRWAAAEGMLTLSDPAPDRERIEESYEEVMARRAEMERREEAARLAALEELRAASATSEVPLVVDPPAPEAPRTPPAAAPERTETGRNPAGRTTPVAGEAAPGGSASAEPIPDRAQGPMMPAVDPDSLSEDDRKQLEATVEYLREAAQHLEDELLGGKRQLTRAEVASLANASVRSARQVWRALGFPRVSEGQKAYTVADVEALSDVVNMTRSDDLLDDETALTLARAIGQTSDRLVVWQMEALVEYLSDTKGLSDVEARAQAIALFEKIVDPLQDVLVYAWRRNLSNALGRLNVNVPTALAMENRQGWYDSSMPLARAIGFADLVSYTRLAQQMEPKELATMVKRFQNIAYNVVATGGGRVIKTIGDEIFFSAETPHAGAEIALTLSERLKEDELMPESRVGFAWGKVLSRMGDIFGSTVNLAARLVAVAEPGTVLTDWDTAHIISRTDDYVFGDRTELHLKGLGDVSVVTMSRGTAPPLSIDV